MKPLGRSARVEENRIGQSWRSGIAQVIGEDIFGNAKIFDLPDGHFQCMYCMHIQRIVRIDSCGFAACESCGTVHNGGLPEESKMSKRAKKIERNMFRAKCQRKY